MQERNATSQCRDLICPPSFKPYAGRQLRASGLGLCTESRRGSGILSPPAVKHLENTKPDNARPLAKDITLAKWLTAATALTDESTLLASSYLVATFFHDLYQP